MGLIRTLTSRCSSCCCRRSMMSFHGDSAVSWPSAQLGSSFQMSAPASRSCFTTCKISHKAQPSTSAGQLEKPPECKHLHSLYSLCIQCALLWVQPVHVRDVHGLRLNQVRLWWGSDLQVACFSSKCKWSAPISDSPFVKGLKVHFSSSIKEPLHTVCIPALRSGAQGS